jgi:hypothetical protein
MLALLLQSGMPSRWFAAVWRLLQLLRTEPGLGEQRLSFNGRTYDMDDLESSRSG